MTLWLIRSGSHGEQEHKFLDESRIFVCWGELNVDLLGADDRQAVIAALAQRYSGDEGTGPLKVAGW